MSKIFKNISIGILCTSLTLLSLKLLDVVWLIEGMYRQAGLI